MTELTTRDLEYTHDEVRMVGYFVSAQGTIRPGLILMHDAFGVSPAMQEAARRAAALGYSVLLADLWGERRAPADHDEIGPLIGGLVGDPDAWIGRMRAAHEQLLAQPEVDTSNVAAFGYCFGGSSVLEYVRSGAELKGGATFHAALNGVGTDWSRSDRTAKVLVLTGAEDPTAPPEKVRALAQGMTAAGVNWEVATYGQTKHAFTNPHADQAGQPDVLAYNPRAAHRSWDAFARFLHEIFTDGADA